MGRDTDLRLIESEQHAQHCRLAAPAHAHACTARALGLFRDSPCTDVTVSGYGTRANIKACLLPSNTQLRLAKILQGILHGP